MVTKKEGAYSSITVDSIAKSPRPCYGGALTKRFIMGKSPNRARLIGRFLEEPRDPEIHEVLPLIPVTEVCDALTERYGLTRHATYQMSYERLAAVVETCETLRTGGLKPSEYDYDTWFRTRQPSLGDKSPQHLLWGGEIEALTAFAERTVAQAKKLG